MFSEAKNSVSLTESRRTFFEFGGLNHKPMDHFIPLSTAITLTTRYRSNRELVLVPAHRQKNVLPVSETFDRAAIESLLAKRGCASVRVYYGMDDQLRVHAVLVPADAQGNDILPNTAAAGDREADGIVERGQRCPDICYEGSPLNP